MLPKLVTFTALLSALAAVSGSPFRGDHALTARQLHDSSLSDIALHHLYRRELWRRMNPISPLHSPTGTTPPQSPWDPNAPQPEKDAKAKDIYDHGEANNPDGNPGGKKDFWAKQPHDVVAEQAKKGDGRTLEQNLPASQQNPADPKSTLHGTDAATQKDAWTSFSGQHVDKELQNNPKGDTTVHQAAKMQPGEDQSVWQDEKKQLLNDPNAPKTITGKDTAAANPNDKKAQWDDHPGTGDRGLPTRDQRNMAQDGARAAAANPSPGPATPAAPTPGNVPNAAAAAAQAATKKSGGGKHRRDLHAAYDAYYKQALMRRALEEIYAY